MGGSERADVWRRWAEQGVRAQGSDRTASQATRQENVGTWKEGRNPVSRKEHSEEARPV